MGTAPPDNLPGGRGQAASTSPQPAEAASGETTRLFDDTPPSAYDPYSEAA